MLKSTDSPRYFGVILTLKIDRGFGFLLTEDRRSIFFPFKECTHIPKVGERVSFTPIVDGQGRPVATNVRIADAIPGGAQ